MPRPLFDSPYIFGLHDPGGESTMAAAGRRGWIVFTEEVGADPNNTSGKDFTPWSNQDFGILCRINNGYGSVGTIPSSDQYAAFAKRVANYVAASPGCKIWIIGNEMNHSQEWPFAPRRAAMATASPAPAAAPAPAPRRGPDQDPFGHGDDSRFGALNQGVIRPAATVSSSDYEPITPELYARCFRLCRDAIKTLPGHGDDQVLIGAVAPWNNQTVYPGNLNGDWIKYFVDVLNLLGPGGLDGLTLHTYTHGPDPALIADTTTMNPPFQNRYFNFLAYRNFMDAVPAAMRELPAYITEADQDDPWLDQNNGWIQAAYANIDAWNQTPGNQQIRSLVLYRWPQYDKWYIVGKQGVIDGFTEAMRNDYRWKAPQPKPANFKAGDKVKTLDIVNFRQSPAGQTMAQLPANTELTVVSSQFVMQNGLIWWNLRQRIDTGTRDGWVAQSTGDGILLLASIPGTIAPPQSFSPGDQVQTLTIVRMRKSPGVTSKPANDIVADVPNNTILTVFSGPQKVDNMTWWRNTGRLPDGRQIEGWMAEALPGGARLLALYAEAPKPPAILDEGLQVGDLFQTLTLVRLRRSPGSRNKPANDVIAEIATGTTGKIIGGPTDKDAMRWWQVQAPGRTGVILTGWMAEALPDGTPLLEEAELQTATFAPGEMAMTADFVNVRRSAGINNKPVDDVLGMLPPNRAVAILGGPEAKDGLTWWRIGGILANGNVIKGSVAERSPNNQPLLTPAPRLPGTNVPDKATKSYLRTPYDGAFGIAQLWGENPAFYGQFVYDGVALQGHNGIDFLTPTGTLLYAVDGGEVIKAGNEPGGFGNFVLLRHPWGESLYAHLNTIGVVAGQAVGRSQPIGISGNSGGSTGPHLHFAIRSNPYSRTDGWGGYRDPLPYLSPAAYYLPAYVLDPATLTIAAALPSPDGVSLRDTPSSMGDIPGHQRP